MSVCDSVPLIISEVRASTLSTSVCICIKRMYAVGFLLWSPKSEDILALNLCRVVSCIKYVSHISYYITERFNNRT